MYVESLKLSGPSTAKSRPCKIIAKVNGNHLLIANIFKIHKYRTFGLIKMQNMSKFWFANNKFNLLRCKFNLLRWNKRHFSWFSKGFQLPEIVSDLRLCWLLTILAIKRGLLCNISKTFKGRRFMGQSSTGLIFSITMNSQSSKFYLYSLNFVKNI